MDSFQIACIGIWMREASFLCKKEDGCVCHRDKEEQKLSEQTHWRQECELPKAQQTARLRGVDIHSREIVR